MGAIPADVVTDVKRRANIGAVVGERVELRKAGRDLLGLCPFHAEKTPSFRVHPDAGYFKCFGCDAKGDVFAFLMQLDGVTFPDAVRELARDVGIDIPDDGGPRAPYKRREPKPLPPAREPAYPDRHEVARLWSACAPVTDWPRCVAYLEGRGIDAGAVAEMDLARALGKRAEQDLPPWAEHWIPAGARLVFRLYDCAGAVRSMKARNLGGGEGNLPKECRAARGDLDALVFACDVGAAILANGGPAVAAAMPAGPRSWRSDSGAWRTVYGEGEIDFLTLAALEDGDAVFAGTPRGWTRRHARRLPAGELVIATDADQSGENYAHAVRSSVITRSDIRAGYWAPADATHEDANDAGGLAGGAIEWL